MTAWTHACRMIWDLADRPDPGKPGKPGTCAHCGHYGPVYGTLGDNFTDYRMLAHPNEPGLCDACAWVFAGRPPATLRMWSVVARVDQPAPLVTFDKPPYVGGKYLQLTNRRDLTWLAGTLADPPDGPWLVAVAESGQKHTAPFTPINHGRLQWTVRVDGSDVTSDPHEWATILAHTAALRATRPAQGKKKQDLPWFSATAIETGQPPIVGLDSEALDRWHHHHTTHLAPYVGSGLLHLANLVITRETSDHYTRTYPAN